MGADISLVLRWWGVLFLVGAVAFPLTKALFGSTRSSESSDDRGSKRLRWGWWDGGYLFSKAVGMAVVTWVVYAMGTIHILPFTTLSVIVSMVLLFIGGILIQVKTQNLKLKATTQISKHEDGFRLRAGMTSNYWLVIVAEEIIFFATLLFWSWVKGHEPSIHGLEKFMDFGFMQSILGSRFFPPADMWYAGSSINYYYFGHIVVAVLTKLSGLDLAYTFNLMLATIFALTLTMSFSIGYQLMSNKQKAISETHENKKLRSFLSLISFRLSPLSCGLLTAFLVTMAGNMQTMYAFTQGYTGDPPAGGPKPFWELFWPIRELWQKLPQGMNTYWYANATRFIPFTIHEFPSYSFVVSDIHGHVLSLPFVLLAIALLIQIARSNKREAISKIDPYSSFPLISYCLSLAFYGFLVGVLLMTNALDGPIYFGLLMAILVVSGVKYQVSGWKEIVFVSSFVFVVAGLISLPFLIHFKSFVNGLALNCPPAFLANSRIGPLIFEGVEKCQHSPVWMMALLWGFFVYCGGFFVVTRIKYQVSRKTKLSIELTQIEKLLVIFFFFSIALIIFPEFFYFKDIYPAHFRSNTMFKLGYQAFILFSIVSAYAIVSSFWQASMTKARVFLLFLLPQLFLVSIYPYFSVRSYFGELREYKGLYGLEWLAREYPGDYAAIQWLNKAISEKREAISENQTYQKSFLSLISYRLLPVLVEADGDSYTDSARFSAFTGIPTIIGWPVHEWLWRGSYDVVAPRREEVRKIYESEDVTEVRQILTKYHVRYIIVGTLERQKYQQLHEEKLRELGPEVFHSGQTIIYRVPT